MKRVDVKLGERSYAIDIEFGIIDKLGEYLLKHSLNHKVYIITDENVNALYGNRLLGILKKASIDHKMMIVPAGESSKSISVLNKLYTQIIKENATRQSTIVAFGGGVVGDLAGFLAASFMRGVNYVQVPTTLLSQVDSSVGGKVGINHQLGKNLIGAFYQPKFVLIDPALLNTLPQRELRAGMAEVIKYSYIWDSGFFNSLNENMDKLLSLENGELLESVIKKCCEIKANVVAQDEKESGIRAILNFGHTIGHALEAATQYAKLLHGEAVSLGMRGAVYLSLIENRIDQSAADQSFELIDKLAPPKVPGNITLEKIKNAMLQDKKRTDKGQLWVLLNKIGQVELTRDVNQNKINKAIEFVLQGKV
jgi:3-dehydroquinate synthase